MSYEEMELLNSITRPRAKKACRRDWLIRMGIQWGGWLVAALVLMANLAVRVC